MSARAKSQEAQSATKERFEPGAGPSGGVPDKSRSVLCEAIWWGADASGPGADR